LEPGESWLLEPKVDAADPCLWSPGIKLGIKPGSWFHQTECFGPVLGLMRAENLDEAIRFQNDVPFGLTAGIHSLDDTEIARWKEAVQSGNAYINRPITGAIIRRQPFGGWKRSSIGPGAKAGGPNYTMQFTTLSDTNISPQTYQKYWNEYFAIEHDPSALKCESNRFRYRPCRGVLLRISRSDTDEANLAAQAAEICGVPLTISYCEDESDESLAARLPQLAASAEFFRTLHVPSDALLRAAYQAGMNWICSPILHSGRYELRHWLREQSVTETQHRYGLITGNRPDPSR
jgi:RHH-type proline utilization regulon transcriptional repressor/proline dehydrogenase/delta 1-pyrroline-5-carboxylate dehydrogenase